MNNQLIYSTFHDVLFPKNARAQDQQVQTLHLRKTVRFEVPATAQFGDCSIVVFDLETTGLDGTHDEIIEIGAQKLVNFRVVEEFSTLVHTNLNLSPEVQKITGITPAMLIGQPPLSSVLPDFLRFIHGSILVAHNAQFDLGFIKASCNRLGIDLEWPVFCTLKMARELLTHLERRSLDALAENYGLTFEARHRSIGDVKVTVAVLREILKNEGSHLRYWRDFTPFQIASAS